MLEKVWDAAPIGLTTLFSKVVRSEALAWFFIGMAFEAAGLTMQYMLAGVSYPILDAVVGFGIGGVMILWQRKQNVNSAKPTG